jgi:hypothetical protein
MGNRFGRAAWLAFIVLNLWAAAVAQAAPYAAFVMDARTGQIFHSENAETPLHPASLTKMMTLYVAFQAIQRGEITLDTEVRVSAAAAAEPPSRLGLREGQTIRLRYLLRAAAVKSANDAATAIGFAIAGSEEAFAARMNAMAAAMGMTSTHFVNMHGLTQEGHYSTARDMSILGGTSSTTSRSTTTCSPAARRRGHRAGNNTNRRFLDAYEGADGIKTGFTNAAGYNLARLGAARRRAHHRHRLRRHLHRRPQRRVIAAPRHGLRPCARPAAGGARPAARSPTTSAPVQVAAAAAGLEDLGRVRGPWRPRCAPCRARAPRVWPSAPACPSRRSRTRSPPPWWRPPRPPRCPPRSS